MAKEKFNWKSLFITEEEGTEKRLPEKPAPKPRSSTTSFPEPAKTVSKFPEHPPKSTEVSGDVLSNVIEMYEAGFESLNKPGYDFYEFFKAVKAVGSNDPQIYKMAMTMAQGVDRKITKSTLLTEADFYIQEIEKVHKQYEAQGNTKKSEILGALETKKENLTSEISALEKRLMEIQHQISEKKNELQTIDANLGNEVADIDQKIVANDTARTKILEAIMTVVDGIKNNI